MTFVAALLVAGLIGSSPVAMPLPLDTFEPPPSPQVAAEAYMLFDRTADVVLLEHNADEPRAMASVTKLMTAIVVRESAELFDEVTVSEAAAATGEAEVGLAVGEVWTVWELLNAIIIRSGNDAATALAQHVGGSVGGFADLMNAKAAELGMISTSFVNPHGLDADGHFSTARDLLTLGLAAFDDPVIARLARTRAVRFRPAPDGAERRAVNTNELLGAFDGVLGLKTGYTSDAGRVLVSAAMRDGRTLVAVVMGTDDHFADTRELLEYGFEMYGVSARTMALAVEEQGSGTGGIVTGEEAQRLRSLAPLPTVDANAPRSPTPLETLVAEAMERLLPPVLVGP